MAKDTKTTIKGEQGAARQPLGLPLSAMVSVALTRHPVSTLTPAPAVHALYIRRNNQSLSHLT
ncbi:MAG: hypothetical protein OJI67_08065 [Prosthecobacter sp.]|nr:hypothetical protein [Prosthecobacter sp.]